MSLISNRAALERPAVLVPIALALLAASAALLWRGIATHDAPRGASLPAPAIPVSHVAANADIARGQIVAARDLRLISGTSAPPASLARTSDAEGHVALGAIRAGETLHTGQISATAVTGIAARVPDGYRAYAVAVSEAEIAGGFLQAGDRVDVAVTLPGALFAEPQGAGKPADKSRSVLLLQSVAVLAAGTKLDGDGNPNTQMRTVTLALKAGDLAKVALAARLGAISFAIRNPVDDTAQPASQAELALLVGDAPHDAPRKAAASRGIPMLLGAARITVTAP